MRTSASKAGWSAQWRRRAAVVTAPLLVLGVGAAVTPTLAAAASSGIAPGGWPKGHQTAELSASDGAAGDDFGYAAATSARGSVAVIGARYAAETGVAYVFGRTAGSWAQVAELKASDGAEDDQFGTSLALSRDGSTLVVGAPGRHGLAGAAYVFTDTDGTWTQTAELSAADVHGSDNFGQCVAISSSGSTVLVGSPHHNSSAGAAYVFAEKDGSWTQTAELTASDGAANHRFGWSVALSAKGSTAMVGSIGLPSASGVGAAYAFARRHKAWKQTAELTPSDGGGGDGFGWSVALSANGSSALISAIGQDGDTGAAYVFGRASGGWAQTAEITPSDGVADDYYGYAEGFSADGKTAVLASPYHNDSTGSAYVVVQKNGRWRQVAELTAAGGQAGDVFGYATALSENGSTAVLGAVGHASALGAAYVFRR